MADVTEGKKHRLHFRNVILESWFLLQLHDPFHEFFLTRFVTDEAWLFVYPPLVAEVFIIGRCNTRVFHIIFKHFTLKYRHDRIAGAVMYLYSRHLPEEIERRPQQQPVFSFDNNHRPCE